VQAERESLRGAWDLTRRRAGVNCVPKVVLHARQEAMQGGDVVGHGRRRLLGCGGERHADELLSVRGRRMGEVQQGGVVGNGGGGVEKQVVSAVVWWRRVGVLDIVRVH